MDRPPNNTNNSSTSHSYSRTTGPVREYVTEYRTTLPAPRPPVSTNITTYTYGNPNGTEFQSTVTTKDFAPVIRSATYGRPPPPEFANGNVAIVEVSAEGKFIAVENTHGTKDENLAGWKIKRCVDGRAPLVFHFPGGVSVRPLGKVKIWAGKGEGGRHKSAGELMFDGVDSWGVGSEMKTVLVDKEGVERATHTMSQNSH
uniref:LTD domain-containing protein n=1 Tax=Ditylenchus dipsaci TaxID=166011 RepID=A0A915CQR4_9BILA